MAMPRPLHQVNDIEQVTAEFQQCEDFQSFIFKYQDVEHPLIQQYVAKAYLRQVLDPQHNEQFQHNCAEFIERFKQHKDGVIQELLLRALHSRLAEERHTTLVELNDDCNELILYSEHLDVQRADVIAALIDAYWFKAKNAKGKDQFQEQYFYHKILNLAEFYIDPQQSILNFRVQTAAFRWQVLNQQFYAAQSSYYRINHTFLALNWPQLAQDLKNNCAVFVGLLLAQQHGRHPLAAAEVQYFLQYLQHNPSLTQLIQQPETEQHYPLLFQLCYLYWLAAFMPQLEQYWMIILTQPQYRLNYPIDLGTLYFEGQQDQLQFQRQLEQLRDKFRIKQKYLQRFRYRKP
jgi:hypothetical protein